MKYKLHKLAALAMGAALLPVLGNDVPKPTKGDKPNILLILIDDMGWKDMGCAGSTYYRTPNIDALASEGMRFVNAYSSSPVCSPSRGAIFTGKNPARTKYTAVFSSQAKDDQLYERSKGDRAKNNQYKEALHRHNLPKGEILFAEVLRDAGYSTGYFGKWHCGAHPDYTPDKRGFQVAKGYRTKHVGTATSQHWGKTFKKYAANMSDIRDEEYIADRLTSECIDFIKENKDKPFLAVMSHYLVHGPIQAKPDKLAKYEKIPTTDQNNPVFASMMESVDESVGRLTAILKELKIADNTLVVFTSDNGGSTRFTSNYPLLGGKATCFEGGLRVPLIMSWPKVIKKRCISKEKTIGMDFYPTFVEMVGIPLKPDRHADGVSLLPILKDNKPLPSRPLIFHFPHPGQTGLYSSIIEGDHKLIHFYNDEEGKYLLFNLKDDQGEMNDLSQSKPELVQTLAKTLSSSLKDMKAEMPTKNPDFKPGAKKNKNLKAAYNLAKKHRERIESRLNQK